MKTLARIATFAFLAAAPCAVEAQPASLSEWNYNDFLPYKDAPDMTMYVAGLASGILWAMVQSSDDGRKQLLYCQPKGVTIRPEQYVEMIVSYGEGHPNDRQYPIGFLLVLALQEMFPCR